MDQDTTAEATSTKMDPLAFMNTIISRATKTIGPAGALHMVCVLNGVDPKVMAISAIQQQEAKAA